MKKWIKLLLTIISVILSLVLIILTITFKDFINKNTGLFSLIFSGIVALSASIYASLTWRLVNETRILREFQSSPQVYFTCVVREEWINFIDFVIHNAGQGFAYNLKFEIETSSKYWKERFSQLKFIEGIKFLPPNFKIQSFFTSLADDFEEKSKEPFTIKIKYFDKPENEGKEYNGEFTIDFSKYQGMEQLGEPPLHKIADSLYRIENHLSNLVLKMK